MGPLISQRNNGRGYQEQDQREDASMGPLISQRNNVHLAAVLRDADIASMGPLISQRNNLKARARSTPTPSRFNGAADFSAEQRRVPTGGYCVFQLQWGR